MTGRFIAAIIGVAACFAPPPASAAALPGPKVDHHQHLLSPQAAEFLASEDSGAKVTTLPDQIAELLRRRTAAWNKPAELEPLYSEGAVLTEEGPVSRRKAVAEFVRTRFG